jgi:hypothetical protein
MAIGLQGLQGQFILFAPLLAVCWCACGFDQRDKITSSHHRSSAPDYCAGQQLHPL